ncbi:MAG TPA: dihydroorotate dehydrogenase-like protein [Vicinamibacterales bacterium]|nr:dihydroorotate dehydrogenase-like protein [Vicinamibacterales bacterium]
MAVSQPPAIVTSTATETVYLGLRLAHPFIAGASPLSAKLRDVRRLEDANAAAIVLHSLFEEQITEAESGQIHGVDPLEDAGFAPLIDTFPAAREYRLAPDEYLEHLRRVKAAVGIPVIASLNGTSRGQWMKYGVQLEQAGADALEVNIYRVLSEFSVSAETVENDLVQAVRDLKSTLKIPLALKLPPFYTAFANLASRLDQAGVDGLVLFNRFYQPDINLRTLTATPALSLSRRSELLLRLRWLAILHGRVRASLAATGGVESANDGVKAVLAGAHAVQVVSALLRHGPGFLAAIVNGFSAWMERHDVARLDDVRGRVSLQNAAAPANFERASYIRTLNEWRRPAR